ncbi:rSAM-modified peptide [Pseudoprevotella muciniphila]|uniref:RSAM-modified peptide n=1 Tax=Pseudoprevotella muciniphila TaxID=2133944 RepID=A0A5P8E8U8_9BACT|nr:TIGR04149 family rSAM-modified RiPP [Pseudoprevotella muciniphila]QFQ13307.1 rSAM-modified peptide [Pseudoprevotella muciniphila]
MKQIKKVVLKEATRLSQEEMKQVFGGSGTDDDNQICGTTCRTKEGLILTSGPTANCETQTVRDFCSGTEWDYAICVCDAESPSYLVN